MKLYAKTENGMVPCDVLTQEEVVNRLDSTDTDKPLSAAMGKKLETEKQDALNSDNRLSVPAGGTGKGSVPEIQALLGLRSLAYLHMQAGAASITIPAGQTSAVVTITYDDGFYSAPLWASVGLWGTNYPGVYGGKYASLSSTNPTATQITLVVQIGTAQSGAVSIPVRWAAIGYHS